MDWNMSNWFNNIMDAIKDADHEDILNVLEEEIEEFYRVLAEETEDKICN